MCSRLIDRLAISDAAERARTLSKSEELYRLSKIKIRSLGNFETCRAALCVPPGGAGGSGVGTRLLFEYLESRS